MRRPSEHQAGALQAGPEAATYRRRGLLGGVSGRSGRGAHRPEQGARGEAGGGAAAGAEPRPRLGGRRGGTGPSEGGVCACAPGAPPRAWLPGAGSGRGGRAGAGRGERRARQGTSGKVPEDCAVPGAESVSSVRGSGGAHPNTWRIPPEAGKRDAGAAGRSGAVGGRGREAAGSEQSRVAPSRSRARRAARSPEPILSSPGVLDTAPTFQFFPLFYLKKNKKKKPFA